MPHMDGLTFVRALRRILPTIPIIVASGRLDDHLVLEFDRLGIQARVDKPFTQDTLTRAIRLVLEGS